MILPPALASAREPGQRIGVLGEVIGQHLDRHVPVDPRIVSFEDDAHPALPEHGGDLIFSERFADAHAPARFHRGRLPWAVGRRFRLKNKRAVSERHIGRERPGF